MRSWKLIVLIMVYLVQSGCAINNKTFSLRNQAFDDGKKLIELGQIEEGIAKLEQARREKPENQEIQAVSARLRDEAITKLLYEAENIRFGGDLTRAEQAYQRILNLYPYNERAREGIEWIRRATCSLPTPLAPARRCFPSPE